MSDTGTEEEWAKAVNRSCEAVGKWLHVQRTSEFMPLSAESATRNTPVKIRGILRSHSAMVEIVVDLTLMREWLEYHDAYVGDGVADL